ncbi:MAG: thiosulfate oxidation carrier complex protein SoxZ [Beijerinckiaceae bacterium]
MANALYDIPRTVKQGEFFTIKIVLSHVMETGYRRDISGKEIPRNIVRELVCHYDGAEIFRADLTQAIAANPYFGFTTVATRSAPLIFTWHDDAGDKVREEFPITVSA